MDPGRFDGEVKLEAEIQTKEETLAQADAEKLKREVGGFLVWVPCFFFFWVFFLWFGFGVFFWRGFGFGRVLIFFGGGGVVFGWDFGGLWLTWVDSDVFWFLLVGLVDG